MEYDESATPCSSHHLMVALSIYSTSIGAAAREKKKSDHCWARGCRRTSIVQRTVQRKSRGSDARTQTRSLIGACCNPDASSPLYRTTWGTSTDLTHSEVALIARDWLGQATRGRRKHCEVGRHEIGHSNRLRLPSALGGFHDPPDHQSLGGRCADVVQQ